MSNSRERRLASDVDDAVELLNSATDAAWKAGLRVELHLRTIPGTSMKVLDAAIYRRVKTDRERMAEGELPEADHG